MASKTEPLDPARMLADGRRAFRRTLAAIRAVGRSPSYPVGLTPKEEIWSLHRLRLYRYVPRVPVDQRQPIPLLLVYAVITRPFIMDLRPGKSFVEFMLDRGFDVYLIDWGEPGPEDKSITFDDYAGEYLPRAIRRVLADSGTDQLNLLGYCIGSIIALQYAALNPEGPVRNLVVLTPPVDQSATTDSKFSVWMDERWFDVDRVVDGMGNLPTVWIKTAAQMLKPVANYVGAYVSLWERADDPKAVQSWQAMHRWVHDGIDLPAETFRQWVRDYVRGNALLTGEHCVRGRTVDLADVTIPILSVIAEYDHIVPIAQSLPLADLVGSEDVQTEILRAGHVGIMSGKHSKDFLWPLVADWYAERSKD
jgi:polyhydroxyalkanoate synthase subunit PhaC